MSFCPGCGDEIQDDTSMCRCNEWEMTNCGSCDEHRMNHEDDCGPCDTTGCQKFIDPK